MKGEYNSINQIAGKWYSGLQSSGTQTMEQYFKEIAQRTFLSTIKYPHIFLFFLFTCTGFII